MRRTSTAVLLALVCATALFDCVAAIDAGRRLRDRALQQRSKRVKANTGVHVHLQTLARAGVFRSASKAHAFLDHIMAQKIGFEAFEHSYGSGFEAKGTADAIVFKHIDATGHIVDATTADRVLVSNDGVDFSYSEMTGVAGDYWAPKDKNANIICNLAVASPKTDPRTEATHLQRFTNAFNDMWSNPDYGRNGANLAKFLASGTNLAPLSAQEKHDGWMVYMENQLRGMLAAEKTGVFKGGHFPTTQHGGSEFYEGTAKSALGNIGSILHDVAVAGTRAKEALSAVSEGNGRALAINDDHFWHCAQETYAFGHKLAVHAAHAAGVAYAAANAAHNAAGVKAAADALTKAYAMDGFVSHFLSDQFSSGHLRTPRVELRTACSGLSDGAKEAGLTANVMHDEDNWNCVLVHNARGNVWWACGDHRFFDQENGMNRRLLHDAIAASVGAVSAAFMAGTTGGADPTAAAHWAAEGLSYVGTTDGLSKRLSVENTCPLYRVEGGKVQQRTGSLAVWPRPAIAKLHEFGSSLRWNMASAPFPAFVDLTTKGDLAQSDAAFLAAMKVGAADPSLTCHEYRPFVERSILPDDCCAVAGRATPQFVTAKTQWDDALPAVETKWPSSADMSNQHKRVTYLNKCFVSQQADIAVQTVKSAVKSVGHEIVQGLAAMGEANAHMGMMGMPF